MPITEQEGSNALERSMKDRHAQLAKVRDECIRLIDVRSKDNKALIPEYRRAWAELSRLNRSGAFWRGAARCNFLVQSKARRSRLSSILSSLSHADNLASDWESIGKALYTALKDYSGPVHEKASTENPKIR